MSIQRLARWILFFFLVVVMNWIMARIALPFLSVINLQTLEQDAIYSISFRLIILVFFAYYFEKRVGRGIVIVAFLATLSSLLFYNLFLLKIAYVLGFTFHYFSPITIWFAVPYVVFFLGSLIIALLLKLDKQE